MKIIFGHTMYLTFLKISMTVIGCSCGQNLSQWTVKCTDSVYPDLQFAKAAAN